MSAAPETVEVSRNPAAHVGRGEAVAALPTWQAGEPPRDREIVLMGNLVCEGEIETWCEPVLCRAVWMEGTGCAPGWHFSSNGLSIRQSPEDRLRIFYWSEVPGAEVSHGDTETRSEEGILSGEVQP